jgi:prepilin signal peptidase PulO-like enzyme (type II secretory pathway)
VWLPHREEVELKEDLELYFQECKAVKQKSPLLEINFSFFKTMTYWLPLGGLSNLKSNDTDLASTNRELVIVELFFICVALLAYVMNDIHDTIYICVFASFMLVAFLTDLSTSFLPEKLTNAFLWVGLITSLLGSDWGLKYAQTPESALVGAMVGYGLLKAFNFAHERINGDVGMAFGDLRLTGAIGAWLGASAIIYVVLIMFVAVMLISLISKRDSYPLGPVIILASLFPIFIDLPSINIQYF